MKVTTHSEESTKEVISYAKRKGGEKIIKKQGNEKINAWRMRSNWSIFLLSLTFRNWGRDRWKVLFNISTEESSHIIKDIFI